MGHDPSLRRVDLKRFSPCVSHKSLIFSCVFFIVVFSQSVFSLKLENNGAYHVVVAIDRKTAKNNIETYVDNIKFGLQTLSNSLYSATDSKFFIKSVDIVLPEHWNFPDDETATINYFQDADIRISHEFQEPYVFNPKLCGSSGEYIQLPYDFFNKPDVGNYGRIGSALLKLWARYRYGVWEEHGYPLESSFPYFFQTPGKTEWNVNYCANIPLNGEFKTLDGEKCDPADTNVNPPEYDCRFLPDSNQNPTSSIMSFHFIESTNKFCDKATHIRNTPNRQNIYCGYRSVREVIEASSDWKSVTQGNSLPPEIEVKVMRMTKRPLLYLVLDGGLTPAPGLIINGIKDNLKRLVNGSIALPAGIIANVGSFSIEAEKLGKSLQEELPWSDIKTNKNNIEKAIDASFSKKSGFRDFASAIKEAVDNIKHRQHEHGSVMVIVKTGEANNFDKIYYEDEVVAAIKELRIKVYIFEVRGNALKPSVNLQYLATETGGTHYEISHAANLTGMLRSLEQNVAKDLRDFQFVPDKKYRTMYKGVVEQDQVILLSVKNVSKLNFHLIPINNIAITGPKVEQVDEDGAPTLKASVTLPVKNDWHPTTSSSPDYPRLTYKGAFTYPAASQPETDHWKITYTCAEADQCSSYLLIYGESSNATEIKSDEVQVFVTTSALDGKVDLHGDLQKEAIDNYNTPFGIYAKLQHNGFPIKNVADIFSVKAAISLRDSSRYWSVDLVDNGIPDVTSNDGIFSGSFVPDVNGIFKISVQVTFLWAREDDAEDGSTTTDATTPTDSLLELIHLRDSGRFVEIGQGLIGCGSDFSGCWATKLPFDFMKVVDYTKRVTFTNAENYIPVPQKVLDFKIAPLNDYAAELEWTHPGVVEASGIGNIGEYELVYNENFEELLDNFNSGTREIFDCFSDPDRDPGTKCNFTIEMDKVATHFYALRSIHGVSTSPVSNIVGITFVENAPVFIDPITPPTTTTTTSTTTTTTTTEPPTTAGPTTSTTSRRTTLSTTTVPTPSRTPSASTTTMTPSTEAPIKHWYEEPEGYFTLAGFGVGLVVLISCGFLFNWWRNRGLRRAKEQMLLEGPIV